MQEKTSDKINIAEIVAIVKDWVGYLLRKWYILVFAGLVGGLIGYYYAYKQKMVYSATLTFALEDEKGGGGGGVSSIAASFGFDFGGGGNTGGVFAGANLIELMKSRTVVEKALLNPVTVNGKQISLAEFYIQVKEWRKNPLLADIQILPNADRSKFTLKQDSVLGVIYQELALGGLTVAQIDKKTSFVTIQSRSNNELFAKSMVEILEKEVSEFYIETKSKKARLNLAILEKQSDSIRAELNAAITGVASANDLIYNLNPALNVKKVPSSRRQVDVQTNTAILTEIVKNLELAKVTYRKETPLLQVIDKPILPLNKTKPGKFKSALLGGFVTGLIMLAFLIGRRWWKKNVIL
jgi:uncharacterized protein involved in exopolysaccharide biosynthesis